MKRSSIPPAQADTKRPSGGPAPVAQTPADFARIGRPAAVGATAAAAPVAAAPRAPASAIWDEAEVVALAEQDVDDGRQRPVYEILHGQLVGTEDVYLGMSEKTPSSLHCDRMVVRVRLPGERLADIDLDVTEQKVTLRSPR